MPQEDAVGKLVAQLQSSDAVERQRAREALVEVGSAAVAPLIKALADPQQHVRWEAAKTLAEIRDPAAAAPLVAALDDDDGDVRWVAGEALIALSAGAAKPLLDALTDAKRADENGTENLYAGAHHVLRELITSSGLSVLQPVREALEQSEPRTAVPVAAEKALEALDQ